MTHTRVTPAPGSLKRHQTRTAYTFLALPLVFFLIVRFLPTFLALRMSLFDWNILKEQQPFVGLDNYRELFQDAKFGQALKNTALYTLIGVPAQIALGLGIALLLSRITALRGLYRAIYFAPYVTPIVAAAWVWQWLFSPQFGPINTILDALKTEGVVAELHEKYNIVGGTIDRHPQSHVANGVDIIVAQGYEAGGHRGNFLSDDLSTQVGTVALVPLVADAVKVQVIAAALQRLEDVRHL